MGRDSEKDPFLSPKGSNGSIHEVSLNSDPSDTSKNAFQSADEKVDAFKIAILISIR